VIRELGLDRAPIDPTALDQEELLGEIQRIIKALLGMGARLPKILMLYVKNLVFLDGAIALLAPDLDLLGEIASLSTNLVMTHGDRFAAELGMEPGSFRADTSAIKASFGIVDDSIDKVTYRDLQQRRDTIRRRFESRR
jgi:ubiquinone biosynthesis protein